MKYQTSMILFLNAISLVLAHHSETKESKDDNSNIIFDIEKTVVIEPTINTTTWVIESPEPTSVIENITTTTEDFSDLVTPTPSNIPFDTFSVQLNNTETEDIKQPLSTKTEDVIQTSSINNEDANQTLSTQTEDIKQTSSTNNEDDKKTSSSNNEDDKQTSSTNNEDDINKLDLKVDNDNLGDNKKMIYSGFFAGAIATTAGIFFFIKKSKKQDDFELEEIQNAEVECYRIPFHEIV